MIEHDTFLDNPIHCQALTYLLDGVFDTENETGLHGLARNLCNEPFMDLLPKDQRSKVAIWAVSRANDAIDDVFVMEQML